MYSYAYRIKYLQRLHNEAFMGLNAVVLGDALPPGAVYRSSLPATPVSTPIKEQWVFSEAQLRDRLCKTPSPRKCRLFGPRHSETGLGSAEQEWIDERIGEDDEQYESSPETDTDSVKENEQYQQKRLFVGNISYRVKKQELRQFFNNFGKVIDAVIVSDHIRKIPKGYGFVTFSKVEEAESVLKMSAADLVLDGRELRVFPANESRMRRIRRTLGQTESERARLTAEIDGDEYATLVGETFYAPAGDDGRVTNINQLPDDCIMEILKHLDIKQRIKIERVCKKWQRLALRVWSMQTKLEFGNLFNIFEGNPLTVDILKHVLKRCRHSLKVLDLSTASHNMDYQAVEVISTICPNLEYLDASRMKITNVSVQQLAQKCPKLKTVILRDCSEVAEKGVWWLLHLCKHLEYVDFSGVHKLTGQCFFMSGPQIRTMILDRCSSITSSGFTKLATKCSFLTTLSLANCPQITDRDLDILCSNLRALKVLKLYGHQRNVTSHGLCSLAKLVNLEELILSTVRQVDDDVVCAMSRACTKLTKLNISCPDSAVSDISLSALSQCPRLTHLFASYNVNFTDNGIRVLACQGALVHVQLRGTLHLAADGIPQLVAMNPQLLHLDVSGGESVSNACVERVLREVEREPRPLKLTIYVGDTLVDEGALATLVARYPGAASSVYISMESYCPPHLCPYNGLQNRQLIQGGGDAAAAVVDDDDDDDAEREEQDFLQNDDVLREEELN